MAKGDRFQTRMDGNLKRWFQKYAKSHGGMSLVFTGLIEDLYKRATGHAWSARQGANGAAEATSPGHRDDPDPEADRPRPS